MSALQSLAFRNFVETCRSPATRKVYLFGLHSFMSYLKIQHDQYDKLLEKDPKIIQMDICDFVLHMKSKKLSYALMIVYIAALNKFYSMNDLVLNWKKIKSFVGDYEKVVEDRPYNHSEIHTLIHNATLRNKALILLMASSGIRIGAIPLLRIKDLEFVDAYKIFKIYVYSRSKRSSYFTFCTPECAIEINNYLDYRKRWGERINPESPLFRADFNITKISDVKGIAVKTVQSIVKNLLLKTGLRKVPTETYRFRRSDIMQCHGFRKFFETNAFKAGMDNMYIRRLMGQKSGLEDAYLKLSEEELLEGDNRHVGYIGITDQLTIEESQRLKKKNQELEINKDKLESRLDKLEEMYRSLV
jgi:integrase